MDLRDSRWDHLLILLIAAAGCLLAKPVPALAEAAANEPDLLPIQVEEPRPVAAALREISARHGLVITYSDVTIECAFASGTPDIIGATLVAGPSGSKFTMKGNSTVAFSQPALDMAQYINKLQVYRVMRWYE